MGSGPEDSGRNSSNSGFPGDQINSSPQMLQVERAIASAFVPLSAGTKPLRRRLQQRALPAPQ